MLTKKSIIIKTLQVASSTLLSKLLGIIREILIIAFLGATDLSDAFLTAFKIPNSLRRIFAEGALSAALIPSVVATMKKSGKEGVSSLITITFIVFEGIVLFLCAAVIMYAESVIRFIAPGFSEGQIHAATPFLQIMMPFIFFVSSSALCAGALQGVGHFLIPSLGSILLNIVFIGSIALCLKLCLSVKILCFGILFAGFIQFLAHFITYRWYGFYLKGFNKDDIRNFTHVFTKFLGSLLSVSIMEISLFVDTSFASYLSKGSISLIYYANRFMNIPLGVFGIAFSTIMLSQFSRVYNDEPEKMTFHVTEAFKLIFWVMVPVSFLMAFFAHDIFYTVFLSEKFTLIQVEQASAILIGFIIGLFFFSFNKILLNVYYAHHDTFVPGIIALGANIINVILNYLLMARFEGVGIALATTISSGILQTVLLFLGLSMRHNMIFSFKNESSFIMRYGIQMLVVTPFFAVFYYYLHGLFAKTMYATFLLKSIGLWIWVSPLIVFYFIVLFLTRHQFGIAVYFLGDE